MQSAVHLGHHISTLNCNDELVGAAVASFWRSFNIFMADFGHINSVLKCKLFKQYCCCFYGAPLWMLSSNAVQNICIAWRHALRRVWGVSYMTHRRTLALLSQSMPLELNLEKRFLRFINRIKKVVRVSLRLF